MDILKVSNLSKIYGSNVISTALKDINFSIEDGEFVGIMGPSGSGKTTLLNLISTIDKPTSGNIILAGKEPHKLKGENIALFRRRELGFVFQDYNLLETLTIGENIVLPLTLENIPIKYQDEKLKKISKILGIEHLLDKRIFEVSGGQAQRTAIARALTNNPSIILADEPTGNLDSKSARDVMELLEKINRKDKVTIMMVTHDPVAASYCNRILFIKDGEIYNEIYKDDNRSKFYQDIIDVLSLLGGSK